MAKFYDVKEGELPSGGDFYVLDRGRLLAHDEDARWELEAGLSLAHREARIARRERARSEDDALYDPYAGSPKKTRGGAKKSSAAKSGAKTGAKASAGSRGRWKR